LKLWTPKSVGSRITAALGLVSVIVGIILGVRQLIPEPVPPQLSVVFILDVSRAMQMPLGEATRLAVARDSILENVASFPGVSTSLRLVNAGCETTYTQPTVEFGKNNRARYEAVFTDLTKQRVSTYREGLNSAANDLTTKKLIQDSKQKLLILFVANRGCEPRVSGIPVGGGLNMQYFWLGAAGDLGGVRKHLEDLGFSDVKVRRIETKKELKSAVNRTVRTRSNTPPIVPPTTRVPPATAVTTPTESTTPTGTDEPTGVPVPDVIGQSQAEARANLEESGLTPSVGLEDVFDPSQDGIVLSQSPPGGAEEASGATVIITVGRYVMP